MVSRHSMLEIMASYSYSKRIKLEYKWLETRDIFFLKK